MINVLHLRDTSRVCGPGKTIIETACAADPREFSHKIGLFMLPHETSNDYKSAAERRGIEVIPVRSSNQFDPRVINSIIRIVKDHRIDLIHSHEYKSDMLTWAASRLHRIPILSTVHGWIQGSLKRRLYVRTSQAVLSRFDSVVAVSGETRKKVLDCGVPEEKVSVIHNAIVASNYRPEDQAPGFLRQRFNLPSHAKIVGYVGRLSPEKGQTDLVTAAAQLLKTRQDLWVALVGDGPDREQLERQASAAGIADRVLFTGHLADVRPAFRDMDIVALTSYTEGFPNVILEGLCMEKPVIANDVGGVREVVTDGVTGLLLPPKSPQRIAEGLRSLLDRPEWALDMMRAGKRLVLEQFTFAARVAQEEALCRQILATWKR